MRRNRLINCLVGFILFAAAFGCDAPLPSVPTSQPVDNQSGREQPANNPTAVPQTDVNPPPAAAEPPSNKVFVPAIQSGESNAPSASAQSSDPHVEVEPSQTTVKVGETFTLVGRPVDIGLPYYSIIARDEGVQDALPMAQATYDNQFKPMEGSSVVVEIVSVEGKMDQITVTMRAKAPGRTTVSIEATGEVPVGYPNPGYSWSGGGSGEVLITVTQ